MSDGEDTKGELLRDNLVNRSAYQCTTRRINLETHIYLIGKSNNELYIMNYSTYKLCVNYCSSKMKVM
jgi:hypothetical protein